MSRRTMLTSLFAVAALTGLVFAWPSIAGTARADAESELTYRREGHSVSLRFGERSHSIVLQSGAGGGFESYAWNLYTEVDGNWGPDGEITHNRSSIRFPTPERSSSLHGQGGFLEGQLLHASAKQADGTTIDLILAGPPDLQPGATTPWQPLAIARELGIAFEWEQTPTHVRVRRGPIPGKPAPKWRSSSLIVGDQGTSFVSDGAYEVASMLRARIPGLDAGQGKVRVDLMVIDDEIHATVVVK